MIRSLYAIYDEEELPVCVGTTEECMKFLHMSKTTFYSTVSKQSKGKIKKCYGGYKVVLIERYKGD